MEQEQRHAFEEYMSEWSEMYASVESENNALTKGLALISSAVEGGVIDKWQWVGSVANSLAARDAIEALGRSMPVTSELYGKGQRAAETIIVFIDWWWKKECVLQRTDTIGKALSTLNDRLIENMQITGIIP